jgi:hypothetical protein
MAESRDGFLLYKNLAADLAVLNCVTYKSGGKSLLGAGRRSAVNYTVEISMDMILRTGKLLIIVAILTNIAENDQISSLFAGSL